MDKEVLEEEGGAYRAPVSERMNAEPPWEAGDTSTVVSPQRGNGGSRADQATGGQESSLTQSEKEAAEEDGSLTEDSDEHLLGAHEGFKKRGSAIPPEERK